MNRAYRRAHTRATVKASRRLFKLQPQIFSLWVPVAKGYLAEFSSGGFCVVKFSGLAKHYAEDEASSAALAFHNVTGLRVAVRPYFDHSAAF